jgi:hypothetical protein
MPRLASVPALHQKRAMLRPSALFGLFLLAACGGSDEGESSAAAGAEKVDCAIAGAAFGNTCTVERITGPDGLTLVIRSPSGSFRRFLVTKDGRGLIAADGAEKASVSVLSDKRIEVAIAGDRYRLPATVKQ